MNSSASSHKGKTIGVIGFNARPLACSIKKLKTTVYVSDYWGDDDLSACCDEWVAVLDPKPGSRQRETLEKPVPVSLVANMLEHFSEIEFDYIVIGSGFDDTPATLEPIRKQWKVAGNSTTQMVQARYKKFLRKIVSDVGIEKPITKLAKSANSATNFGEIVGYPFVIRSLTSGGGSGIRVVTNKEQLDDIFSKHKEPRTMFLQQLISGFDASASVLGTGTISKTLSIQGQLIGMPTAGRNCDFVYCGNYYPSLVDVRIMDKLESISEEIIDSLGLLGSNGIDYVVDYDGKIWFLEINPRIQGTLEMLERASDMSVSKMHLDAFEGALPDAISEITPCCKMIVYSSRSGQVPDLAKFPSTVDRSPEGTIVKIGDPICSIIETGNSLNSTYARVVRLSLDIQRNVVGKLKD